MGLQRLLFRLLLGTRLPQTDGYISVKDTDGPITIRRDRFGIPYIEAEGDDAWFGLGFCQAQDRAFQLELRLRTVRGTLSALFGKQTLAIDRLARRIGFREASERQLEALDADIRRQVEAFARGINAGYERGLSKRPHEFALLRRDPTLWEPADVIGVGKLMSFLLIGNWDVELARLKILSADGPQALRDLDPFYSVQDQAPTPQGGPAIDRLSEDLAALLGVAGVGGGSNNWALSGARTASGRPILANDPHLDASLPPHWYLAHLRTPEWAVAGASLIGAPAIGLGHNGFAAWGITAGLMDTADLFIEEVGPDGCSVRQGEGLVPCEVRREVIEVKGEEPVVEEVLVTSRGPVISPALDGDFAAISLRAVWLDAKPARGFLHAHQASTFEEFRNEFRAWPLLSQNLVYADTNGDIAWQLVGEVPRRRGGWGMLPRLGHSPESGWHETGVGFEEMPFTLNPASGFVASANNQPALAESGPYLGADWLDSYRFDRIVEVLASRKDWDVAGCLALQLDQASLTWREVRDVVLALPAASAEAGLALEMLAGWDGAVGAGSAPAAVFEMFISEMWQRVVSARAPRSAEWAIGKGFTPLLPITTFAAGRSSRLLSRLKEQPEGWFARSWPEEMADALATVVRSLRSEHGNEEAWAWGKVRPLTLEHPLGRIKALAPIFNRGPFPWGGDGNTVSQAGTTPFKPASNPLAIASVRMAVEIGDWEGARFVLPGGQSGNPFSPHYDDLLSYWRRGEGVPIAWSPEAVAGGTRSTLHLTPP